MNKPKRQFIQESRAWYGKTTLEASKLKYTDEVLFGLYYKNDGTDGEMVMRWCSLKEGRSPVAKLEVFADSFKVLNGFMDVIKELAKSDREDMQPEEFCELLEKCGFEDATPEKEK